jgi:NADH:ubiquinone oxidoreductase subunit 6 (subunit J)
MGIVFLIQFFLFLENRVNSWDFYSTKIFWESDFLFDDSSNLIALGDCLYNSYYILFLLAGLILLIALLGSINLTLNFTSLRTTEVSFRQLSRSSKFLAFFK